MPVSNEFRKALARRDRIQALTMNLVESDPWVPVRLRGIDYKLEYSYNAVVEVFRATGIEINLTQIGMEHIGNPDVFQPLLAAGLRTHHSGEIAGIEAAGSTATCMVPMRHLNYVHACILRALQAAEPNPEDIQRILDETDAEFANEEQQELPLVAAPSSDGSGQGAETSALHIAK